jgi:hypothetical protein
LVAWNPKYAVAEKAVQGLIFRFNHSVTVDPSPGLRKACRVRNFESKRQDSQTD